MSRHRDVRKLDLDDYADDDDEEYEEAGSYDDPASAYTYNRQANAPIDPRDHHRAQLAAAAHKNNAALPQQVEQSAAFFKTKPAKKGKQCGGGAGASSSSSSAAAVTAPKGGFSNSKANTPIRAPPPGFAATPTQPAGGGESELFGGDEFDEETRAAIAASLADQQREQQFKIDAGLVPSTANAAPPPSSSPQPLRSQDAARETEAALEQLRLDKMRRAGSFGLHPSSSGDFSSAASTPKRQISNESPSRSPSLGSMGSGGTGLGSMTPIKIDRLNLPVPTKLAKSVSLNSLAPPNDQGSQPGSPRTPGGGPRTPGGGAASSSSSGPVGGDVGEAPAPTVSAKRAREVTQAEEAEASAAASSGATNKERLNMVVIGHVDAGKSTLMGHLLFLQGRVSKKLMHKYEKESKELGKASFHFAWVLDETEEERARGITVDVACNYFETPTKKITLLDAPGHKEFIPAMITGAAQADAAILVVPATKGEFEGGFGEDGQIREHAVLARSLGVSQLILAVNKLDTVGWSQSRYTEIVSAMIPYLKSVGYKEKDIWSIPVSGLTGQNIMENTEPLLKQWYDGPVLLDLIDKFALPTRHTDKPMRLCIQDVFKGLTLGQTVCGKVETGTILLKDRLLLLPLGETISVKAMESRGENLTVARAGDNVEIGIKDYSDVQVLQVGQWLCDPLHPIPMVTHFRAQIITMNYKIPLVQGTQLTFFTQAATEPIMIHSILSIIDKVTGAVVKKSPRVLPRQTTAIVELTSKSRICLELFRNYRELGRFTLRRGNETVAVGITTKLFRTT